MIDAVTTGFFAEIVQERLDFTKVAYGDEGGYAPADAEMEHAHRQRGAMDAAHRFLGQGAGVGVHQGGKLKQLLARKGFYGKMDPTRVGKFLGMDPDTATNLMSAGVVKAPAGNRRMENLMREDAVIKGNKRQARAAQGGPMASLMGRIGGFTKKTTAPVGMLAGAGMSGLMSGYDQGRAGGAAGAPEQGGSFFDRNKGLLGVGAGLLGARMLHQYMGNQKANTSWPSPAHPSDSMHNDTEAPRAPQAPQTWMG